MLHAVPKACPRFKPIIRSVHTDGSISNDCWSVGNRFEFIATSGLLSFPSAPCKQIECYIRVAKPAVKTSMLLDSSVKMNLEIGDRAGFETNEV